MFLAYVPNCRLFLRKPYSIITVHFSASVNAVPHSPKSSSQDLSPDFKTFRVVTPQFRRHHDLLHQGMLSILSVWHVSKMSQSPCLSSVGFLHGSDQGSYTAFRYQGQWHNDICMQHFKCESPSAPTAGKEIGFRSISHLSIRL